MLYPHKKAVESNPCLYLSTHKVNLAVCLIEFTALRLPKAIYLQTGSQMRSAPFSCLENRLFSHRICRKHSPSSFFIAKNASMDFSTRIDMAFSASAEPTSYGVSRRTRCRPTSSVVVVVVPFCEASRVL